MKKQLILTLLVFLLIGCVWESKSESKVDQSLMDENLAYLIVLVVEDGVIEYRLTNDSDEALLYSSKVTIEEKSNNKWYALDLKPNMAFDAKAYNLSPNNETVQYFKYNEYYGDLKPGDYRIVVEIGKDLSKPEYLVGTFKVE